MYEIINQDCIDYMQATSNKFDYVYFDPPYGSARIFGGADKDFSDRWSQKKISIPDEIIDYAKIIKNKSMINYLSFMYNIFKQTGEILKEKYLITVQCDDSGLRGILYLLDLIFGYNKFKFLVSWTRHNSSHNCCKEIARTTDYLIFYGNKKLNRIKLPLNPGGLARYNREENGRKYSSCHVASPKYNPKSCYEFLGFPPPKNGWRYKKETFEKLFAANKLIIPLNQDGTYNTKKLIRIKTFFDESLGKCLTTNWQDIQRQKKPTYPTQKPLALMERLLLLCTKEDDLVYDPFCGSSQLGKACEKLKRNYIGTDINKKLFEEK